MASSKAHYLMALLSLVSLAQSMARTQLFGPTNNVDLISSTCNRTHYVDVCVSSLGSDPRSHGTDLKGLATIALNVTIIHGMETISLVKKLRMIVKDTDQILLSKCLGECVNEYYDALGNLGDSINALGGSWSHGTINALITGAMTDSDTCENGFNEEPGIKSPLTQRNKQFFKLCSNALTIADLLA